MRGLILGAAACWMAACPRGADRPPTAADRAATHAPAAASAGHDPAAPHNLVRASETIYSGGEPHSEETFARLAEMGVRTIVSVDAARPDVELAGRYGLRYVHIPIGYDGVPQEAALSIARAVRDAEGPFYFHCHHGRHRGPAAAAVACIAAGHTDVQGALALLDRAGTSRKYAGLWRDVEGYTPPPPGTELPELVEVAQVESLNAAMAGVDRSFDNLKQCQAVDWTVPPDHPDLVPAEEARKCLEGLQDTAQHAEGQYDDEFHAWLQAAQDQAALLREALAAGRHDEADAQFELLTQSCDRCHARHRDH